MRVQCAQVSALEHAVNGEPVLRTSTAGFDSAAPAADRHRRRDRGRHRRPGRWQAIANREISQDRRARLRLLAGSLIGAGCLLLAYRLQPGEGSPFAAPSGTVAWIALIAGIAGIGLVPGLWLSAVMMRTGAGPAGRLATRIGTTLTWYALVGPVVHLSADGAMVTAGGIVGTTVAATAAVCLGVALGLVRRPANPMLRVLMAALVGGICAQTVIWLSTRLFPHVNYEQIRRLDWLIVLACALLTAMGRTAVPTCPWCERLGTSGGPHLSGGGRGHRRGASRHRQQVVAGAAHAVRHRRRAGRRAVGGRRGIRLDRYRAGRSGADSACRLHRLRRHRSSRRGQYALAPRTARLIRRRCWWCWTPRADHSCASAPIERATEQGWPVKLTVRDQASGMLVQAVIPAGWCAP